MAFPTHIVSAGGIVEDGNGNILLVKAHDDGWVNPIGKAVTAQKRPRGSFSLHLMS
ncbi:hypothetical protein [Paenibacillus sp. J2TS4]|uniref:hypothetical protein n=1 Tax=Paenibacillus sp. J2TS4 TaxID=2807194 RepID=UPI001B1B944B|nr:hypothetical protein [Paenibacillus sp. J2TS4]GIP35942.1 hypothetical protein J2TS4_51520 [Paenibacillus sp. J2TS4]